MKKYSLTQYIPGDIFLAHDGSIGMIVKAQWGHRNWNDEEEEWDGFGNPPTASYCAESVPGFQGGKYAWWHEGEFKEVLKGPLHDLLSGNVKLKLK